MGFVDGKWREIEAAHFLDFFVFCSYGFVKFNTLLFGAVQTRIRANTTRIRFSGNSQRG